MRVSSVLAVNAILAVLLVASPATHAAPPRACGLLTAQIAASLLGGPVGAPTDLQGILCSYGTKTATVSLSVTEMQGMAPADFSRAMQASTHQSGFQQVPGLGDAGFFIPAAGDQNLVNVLYHNQSLSLSVRKKLTPELKSQMLEQMKQWLAKL